jgi:hypothetical protein
MTFRHSVKAAASSDNCQEATGPAYGGMQCCWGQAGLLSEGSGDSSHVKRFCRGMTLRERQAYRAEILEREVERAHRAVSVYHISPQCREGNALNGTSASPELRKQAHDGCREEEPGGSGCLCTCHDRAWEEASGVASGTSI